MRVTMNCFPGGKPKALVMSYDDGRTQDRRLVEIFNRCGVRGTFHLNSGMFGRESYITADEVAELFSGHEVSAHSANHPHLDLIPRELLAEEILQDRRTLESLVGYPVRGMSYPYGTYNEDVRSALPRLGIEYARTVVSHYSFRLPEDPLTWPATCHHAQRLDEMLEKFLNLKDTRRPALFYVWGHSYEFDESRGGVGWIEIENFCNKAAADGAVWMATNIEVADYLSAVRNLRFDAACTMVYNPSAIAVCIRVEGQVTEISPGKTCEL
jgi:peptidoglycan/xylan/chitin deacetylase (PgdA/CDA1 family)